MILKLNAPGAVTLSFPSPKSRTTAISLLSWKARKTGNASDPSGWKPWLLKGNRPAMFYFSFPIIVVRNFSNQTCPLFTSSHYFLPVHLTLKILFSLLFKGHAQTDSWNSFSFTYLIPHRHPVTKSLQKKKRHDQIQSFLTGFKTYLWVVWNAIPIQYPQMQLL